MYFDPAVDYRTVRETGYVPGGWLEKAFFPFLNRLGVRKREKPAPNPESLRKIIVVKLGGVGDVLLATTILPHLKQRFRDARIGLICCKAATPAFRSNPFVDEVFASPVLDAADIRELSAAISGGEARRIASFCEGTDLVVFLNRIVSLNGFLKYLAVGWFSRGARMAGVDTAGRGVFYDIRVPDAGFLRRHEVSLFRDVVRKLGGDVPAEGLKPLVYPTRSDREAVDAILGESCGERFAVLHPGSSGAGWRKLKRIDSGAWRDFISAFSASYGMPILLVGAGEDAELNRELVASLEKSGLRDAGVYDLTDRTTLTQLCELISRASVFIGTDSGVAHLASCTDVPIVTVFTFASPVDIAPWSPRSHVVRKELPCSPCIYWKGYRRCEGMECQAVSAKEILDSVSQAVGTLATNRVPQRRGGTWE